jgi:hypothetical protein
MSVCGSKKIVFKIQKMAKKLKLAIITNPILQQTNLNPASYFTQQIMNSFLCVEKINDSCLILVR